jgi:biotin operon repressor
MTETFAIRVRPKSFSTTHAHRDDIDTSHEAAGRAENMASRHRSMVHNWLMIIGPQSSEQIAAGVGLDSLQVMKRISDLRSDGVVIDSGERRLTRTGRKAAVWKLKQASK